MNVGKFSVSNPVLINVIMFVVIFAGVVFALRLPKEDFPEVPFYFISITVPYAGVAADDIERTVTIKIEDEMQSLEFLHEMTSTTTDGLAIVQLEFEDTISDAEFETALQEVRARFGDITLPADVGNEIIDDFSSADFAPIIQVVIFGDTTYADLIGHAERLARIIKRGDYINDVSIVGERELEVLVEIDRERSETYGMSLQQIAQAVRSTNVAVPGGTLRGAARVFLLRTDESADIAADIGQIPVRSDQGAQTAYINDIGTVTPAYDRDGVIFRYNGQPAVSLAVVKTPRGDEIAISRYVRNAVATYQQSPSARVGNVQFDFFGDNSVNVNRNIRVLGANLLLGFVLVVLVLYSFLGMRNSILIALGIPISFGASFIILDSIGITLNSNVLFALVLVLGLIVDHAIVIIENAYRYELAGRARREAAVIGVNQVVAPVIAATATTIAAFLPLAFLPGIIGRFLQVVPIAACIALTLSTLEALFILPSHYADWGRESKALRSEKRFDSFRDRFERVITFVYRHRVITVIVFAALIVVSVALFGTIGQDLFTTEENSLFYIDIFLPTGSSLRKTDAIVQQFETVLSPLLMHADVVSMSATVGLRFDDSGPTDRRDNVGQITIDLLDIDEGRVAEIDAIIAEARALTIDIVGIDRLRFRKIEGGPPSDAPIVYRLRGNSYEELEQVSRAIQGRLETYPQLVDIRDDFEEGAPELRAVIDVDSATRLGLSVQQIGSFLHESIEGINAGQLLIRGEERDIVVTYREDTIARPDQLLSLSLPRAGAVAIPLSSVARIETSASVNAIRRFDQRRQITIQADATDTENLFVIDNDIRAYFQSTLEQQYPDIELNNTREYFQSPIGRQYADIELVVGGEFAEFANLLSDILILLGVGIFLIYATLGAQLKSYVQPILIIATIPFAFLGIILYLIISGNPLSIVVIYATVALAGIAVNDAIVLISFINELRAGGEDIHRAVIRAATLRLRPILLTSITTIFGLLPTALGLGGRSVVWIPMANTIIFGLLFSTATTLIIVPCLYGLLAGAGKKSERIKQ